MIEPTPVDPDPDEQLDAALSRAPTGFAQAQRLLDALRGRSDSLVEGGSLEVKTVDQWKSAHGQIAKFILAAGNRTRVSPEFEGLAVMVLGIDSDGEVRGVPPRDRHEIHGAVERLLPARHPDWDFLIHRDRVTQEHVVIVHVKPAPAGSRMFISGTDRAYLEDGAVYVRTSSDTRRANSAELNALLDREHSTPPAEIEIQCLEPVVPVHFADEMGSAIREAKREKLSEPLRRADAMQPLVDAEAAARFAALAQQLTNSLAGFRHPPRTWEEIAEWETDFTQHWERVKLTWMGLLFPAVDFSLANLSMIYLEDVEVTVTLHGPVAAVAHRDIDEDWRRMRRALPGFGLNDPFGVDLVRVPPPPNGSRTSAVNTDEGVEVTIHLPSLAHAPVRRATQISCSSQTMPRSRRCSATGGWRREDTTLSTKGDCRYRCPPTSMSRMVRWR